MNNSKMKYGLMYDVIITILALISVTLVFMDLFSVISIYDNPYRQIDLSILLVFWIDYLFRLFKSDNKFYFIKNHIVDLIAIIPFSPLFSLFRIAKIAQLIRAIRLIRVIKNKVSIFLHTNGFIYVLYCSIVLIIFSSIVIMFVEDKSFADSLWWSIVTVTTVGYGDISPTSTVGRFVAVILMFFGIGFISMLTGAITTYFAKSAESDVNVELFKEIKKLNKEDKEKVLKYIKDIK